MKNRIIDLLKAVGGAILFFILLFMYNLAIGQENGRYGTPIYWNSDNGIGLPGTLTLASGDTGIQIINGVNLMDMYLTDNGDTYWTTTRQFRIQPAANTFGFRVLNGSGGIALVVDTQNDRLGIGTSGAPAYSLHIGGNSPTIYMNDADGVSAGYSPGSITSGYWIARPLSAVADNGYVAGVKGFNNNGQFLASVSIVQDTGTDPDGELVFHTTSSGDAGAAERLRITHDGNFLYNSLETFKEMVSLADDAEIFFETAVAGYGYAIIGDNQEFAPFTFTSAGVVTLLTDASTNTASTDSDGNLCVYDAGSGIAIKNRLGSELSTAISVDFYTP